jgi:hypothetical protein
LEIKTRQEEEDAILNQIVGGDGNDDESSSSSSNSTHESVHIPDDNQDSHDSAQTNVINAEVKTIPTFEQPAVTPNSNDSTVPRKPEKPEEKPTDSDKFKKAIVLVEHDGRPARLMLDKRPTTPDGAWLKYEDDGQLFETPLSSVQLVRLIEG